VRFVVAVAAVDGGGFAQRIEICAPLIRDRCRVSQVEFVLLLDIGGVSPEQERALNFFHQHDESVLDSRPV
jgi:hypothetical protein